MKPKRKFDSAPTKASTLESQPDPREPRSYRVIGLTLASALLLWLAFPPVGWWWFGWIASVPLIWLVQDTQLVGNRPYRQLFLGGLIYWLATFYFIPIPHPVLWLGWFAVSFYLALYTPLLVAVSRTMVHRMGIPILIAVPVAWTGIEWIRCHVATGMAMVCLSHTQAKQPHLIQIADLFGAYTLTFVMVLVGTGLAVFLRSLTKTKNDSRQSPPPQRIAWMHLALPVLALGLVIGYGHFRLNEPVQISDQSELVVGIVQTSEDVIFGPISEEQFETQTENKRKLTHDARRKWNDLDLIVWPESGFPSSDLLSDVIEAEESLSVAEAEEIRLYFWSQLTGYPQVFDKPIKLLTGTGTYDPENDQKFNAAITIGHNGDVINRYYKNHLVMFGEYVPFAQWFPVIDQISPIPSINRGDTFETISINDVTIAPSICFETTIPHLIRRQINTLSADGNEPDVMVNLTNDGWFFGTSCLDHHLACNVFRAVEMRKPHLVCANTGFSAQIDSCGRLLQVGPRRQSAIIRASVKPVSRTSVYRSWGEWVNIGLAAIVAVVAVIGWISKPGRKPTPSNE